jgi:hypothetical protein
MAKEGVVATGLPTSPTAESVSSPPLATELEQLVSAAIATVAAVTVAVEAISAAFLIKNRYRHWSRGLLRPRNASRFWPWLRWRHRDYRRFHGLLRW